MRPTNASERTSRALRRLAGPEIGVPSTSCDEAIDRDAFVLRTPSADCVEVLERQTDRIHDLVARGAGRVAAVLFEALADRFRGRRRPFSSNAGTSGGGSGGGLPSRFCRIHVPRITGEVRFGFEVTSSRLPCPSRPRRASLGTGTRRKSGPYTCGMP